VAVWRSDRKAEGLLVVRQSFAEPLAELHAIRKNPKFFGRRFDALEMEELSEHVPGMLLLRVVVIGQHGSEHVPLEVFEGQVPPLVAPRYWSSDRRREPSVIAQREAASVGKVGEFVHIERESLLEVLEKVLDRGCLDTARDGREGRAPGGASPPAPEEPLSIIVFGN